MVDEFIKKQDMIENGNTDMQQMTNEIYNSLGKHIEPKLIEMKRDSMKIMRPTKFCYYLGDAKCLVEYGDVLCICTSDRII